MSVTCGSPGAGGGGVTWSAGSLGGVVSWNRTWSKSTSPVFSMTVMWSSTVSLAWSASCRTRLFLVVARIFATVVKIWPCVVRRMFAMSLSNCLPVSPSSVATNPCCWGLAWLGTVMFSRAATRRSVASSAACPSTRC